jgi:hypothetical protein
MDFAQIIEPVARKLLGNPNRAQSSKTELRFGTNGSVSVDLRKGTYYDHEAKEGGGALDFIVREARLSSHADALKWLKSNGFNVNESRPRGNGRASTGALGEIVATYDYIDENGKLILQVCRLDPKDFRQRKPDRAGGWDWSTKGCRRVPYRLPELIEAIAQEQTIFIVEGEKDVDALRALHIPSTTNAGGTNKWHREISEHFASADVVLIPDNDEAGRNHMRDVADKLAGIAKRVRVFELPDLPLKGDISDWLVAGGRAA